jgi:hypothetical protein
VFWEKTTDERTPPESLAGVKMPNGKGKSAPRNRDEMLKYSETNTGGHTAPVWNSQNSTGSLELSQHGNIVKLWNF